MRGVAGRAVHATLGVIFAVCLLFYSFFRDKTSKMKRPPPSLLQPKCICRGAGALLHLQPPRTLPPSPFPFSFPPSPEHLGHSGTEYAPRCGGSTQVTQARSRYGGAPPWPCRRSTLSLTLSSQARSRTDAPPCGGAAGPGEHSAATQARTRIRVRN